MKDASKKTDRRRGISGSGVAAISCIALLACVATLLVTSSRCAGSDSRAAGRLEATAETLEFFGTDSEQIDVGFRNPGLTPLEVRIDPPSCSCVALGIPSLIVPANSVASYPIRVSFQKIANAREELLVARYSEIGAPETLGSLRVLCRFLTREGIKFLPDTVSPTLVAGEYYRSVFRVLVRSRTGAQPTLSYESRDGTDIGCAFVLRHLSTKADSRGDVHTYEVDIAAPEHWAVSSALWRTRWRHDNGEHPLEVEWSCAIHGIDQR